MDRPLRCRLGLHAWRTVSNEDRQPILECARCLERDVPTKQIRIPIPRRGGNRPIS